MFISMVCLVSPARLARLAVPILVSLSLTACGGGGDSASATVKEAVAQEVARRLDDALAGAQARHPWVPGVTARVLVDDGQNAYGLNWAGATGVADRTTSARMLTTSRYVMASVTKTYVAASILKLVEQGRLTLADSLATRLGADSLERLRANGVEVDRITVDMLLAHTSGLRDYVSAEYLQAVASDPARVWTRTEQLQFALDLGPALAAPGAAYRYADTGYLLLGEILEARTGKPLPQAVRGLLQLDALGQASTAWQAGDSFEPIGVSALSHPYVSFGDTVVDLLDVDPSVDLYGGGGLVSTAGDAARFVRALISGRVIGAAQLATMQSLGPGGLDAGVGGHYARGLTRFDIHGAVCWGHVGAWGAFSAHCPGAGVTLAFTLNSNGDPEGRDGFQSLDLAKILFAAVR